MSHKYDTEEERIAARRKTARDSNRRKRSLIFKAPKHKVVTIIDPLLASPYEITLSELQQYKSVYLAQGVKILIRGEQVAIQAELWK